MVLHRVEGRYTVLFGVRQGYMVLHGVIECYTMKHFVTGCYMVLQGVCEMLQSLVFVRHVCCSH